jgi:hypothetical protein
LSPSPRMPIEMAGRLMAMDCSHHSLMEARDGSRGSLRASALDTAYATADSMSPTLTMQRLQTMGIEGRIHANRHQRSMRSTAWADSESRWAAFQSKLAINENSCQQHHGSSPWEELTRILGRGGGPVQQGLLGE